MPSSYRLDLKPLTRENPGAWGPAGCLPLAEPGAKHGKKDGSPRARPDFVRGHGRAGSPQSFGRRGLTRGSKCHCGNGRQRPPPRLLTPLLVGKKGVGPHPSARVGSDPLRRSKGDGGRGARPLFRFIRQSFSGKNNTFARGDKVKKRGGWARFGPQATLGRPTLAKLFASK